MGAAEGSWPAGIFCLHLTTSWTKLGEVREMQHKSKEALEAYESALGICAYLLSCDPPNTDFAAALTLSWEKISGVGKDLDDLDGAFEALSKGKEIGDSVFVSDHYGTTCKRSIAICWNKLGKISKQAKDLLGAADAYNAQYCLSTELELVGPTNVKWQRDVLGAHCKLASVLAKLPDRTADAIHHLKQRHTLEPV